MPCTTDDMVIVHRVFRREFGAAPQYVRDAAGDATRKVAVADHLTMLLHILHHHHQIEDSMLWPKLTARAVGETPVPDTMSGEHARLATLLDEVAAATEAWQTAPGNSESLTGPLEALDGPLNTHLDHEERDALPLCARYIDQVEWDALGVVAMDAMGPQRWLTFVCAMHENCSDDEWTGFLAVLPPEAAAAVAAELPAYAEHMLLVRHGRRAAV